VLVAIMAPRSGKTSGLAIPAILAAPGPVVLTSNKAANDAFTATFDARATVGTVWTLDPQQIAHHPREMWWDILADARDLAGAKRLAGHFVAASVDESAGSDFWSTAASNTLAALFLAAASHRRPITDALVWLASPADRTPVDLLTDSGHHAVAAQLQGTVSGATETRDGIYETARQYASCLLDPDVAAWVTPAKGLPQFKPHAFATSRDTLYLLSKDGGGSASAIIAAAADAVMRGPPAEAGRGDLRRRIPPGQGLRRRVHAERPLLPNPAQAEAPLDIHPTPPRTRRHRAASRRTPSRGGSVGDPGRSRQDHLHRRPGRARELHNVPQHPIAHEAQPFIQADRMRVVVPDPQLDLPQTQLAEPGVQRLRQHRGAIPLAPDLRRHQDPPEPTAGVRRVDPQRDVAHYVVVGRIEGHPALAQRCRGLSGILDQLALVERPVEVVAGPIPQLEGSIDPRDELSAVRGAEVPQLNHGQPLGAEASS
jgi:hypothetical protein